MKNKVLNALVLGFTFFACSCCRAASAVKVEVLRGTTIVATVSLPSGQVKAAAKNFKYDASSGVWTLTGKCAVTVIQDGAQSLRFEGDTATVAAENIERQISSSSPIDHPNLPILDLSEALNQDSNCTLFRLTWFYSMGGYSSSGTALYDRQKHTVKENIRMSDMSAEIGGYYRYLYTKVDDKAIDKAAKEIGREGSGPFGFGILIRYGAIREETGEP